MSSDGAEIRFWTYFDTTTTGRIVDDIDPSINNAARAFLVNFQNNGALSVYTSKAGNPRLHHQRLHPGGHLHHRLDPVPPRHGLHEPDLHALEPRSSATDAWTPIKAPGATGYAIPMLSATTVTATHGTRWRSYYAAQPVGRRHRLLDRPASPTCSAPTPSPPSAGAGGSIAPVGRHHRRPRRLAGLHHHTGLRLPASPTSSSTASRSEPRRPTRSQTSPRTTPSPRASRPSPPAATCRRRAWTASPATPSHGDPTSLLELPQSL